VSMSEWTAAGLALVAALVGLYDLTVYLTHGHEATVSAVILTTSRRYPILPFMLGVLIGHLLWPQQ
jgi:hypothetical protein